MKIHLALSCVLLLSLVQHAHATTASVEVDFSKPQAPPLVKKYGVLNSGLVAESNYTPAVLKALAALKPSALRMDLGFGRSSSFAYDAAFGTPPYIINNFASILSLSQSLAELQVPTYWSHTYDPKPLQPTCDGSQDDCTALCPGTNYTCTPYPQALNDCWKCPPMAAESYQDWSDITSGLAGQLSTSNLAQAYNELWNEPDLTDYPPGAAKSTFKGTSRDYINLYTPAAKLMRKTAPDSLIGGPALAYNILGDPLRPDSPSGLGLVQAAASKSLPLDFFSFHVLSPCIDAPGCDVTKYAAEYMTQARELLANASTDAEYLKTTQIHCSQFFPGISAEQFTTAYANSYGLATLLLDTFFNLLYERDLMQVLWAQYLDILENAQQIGLVDTAGNARPAWHAFHFYALMPIERVELTIVGPSLGGMASFSEATCAAGVLLWRPPFANDTNGPDDLFVGLSAMGLQLRQFNVSVWQLDEGHVPQEGFSIAPSFFITDQEPGPDGDYLFAMPVAILPPNGTAFIQLKGAGCSEPTLPHASVLRPHYYFGRRVPAGGSDSYAYFDARAWSVHLGQGSDEDAWVIAGATILVEEDAAFHISMKLAAGKVPAGAAWGMRVDYYSPGAQAYPTNAAHLYLQHNVSRTILHDMPILWGSQQSVPQANIHPSNTTGFIFDPWRRAPRDWEGKLTILFVMHNATPGSMGSVYITDQQA